MKVELIDHMGSDLSVVNAARVSYRKYHDTFTPGDSGLLKYLADHNHWTPFAHPQLSFRISASIAVARQLYRHQVGLAVNEVSRRYVTDAPTFDLPEVWRSAPGAGQSKQGSGGPLPDETQARTTRLVSNLAQTSLEAYDLMLFAGVAPEQARLVLPISLVTEWIWTGSLMAFIRVCLERMTFDAQAETRAVADAIYAHLRDLFPQSVMAWGLWTA